MFLTMRMPLVLLVLHSAFLVVAFNQLPGDTDLSCTDDSDCIPLGHKFGCFLYRCNSIAHNSIVVSNQPPFPHQMPQLC